MGKKWLLIAALALVALVIVLWRQLSEPATAAPAVVAKAAPAPSPAPTIAPVAPPVEDEKLPETNPYAVHFQEAPPPAPPATGKYDPQSDEFFFKHDEVVIPNVMRSVVKCWEELEPAKQKTFYRKASTVIKFKQKIVNGTVTMTDATIERDGIKDAALVGCFQKQVVATTWHDDKLPDWEQDDEVKISPQTLKKYTKANREYVGAEAPPQGTYLTREQIKADFDPNYKE